MSKLESEEDNIVTLKTTNENTEEHNCNEVLEDQSTAKEVEASSNNVVSVTTEVGNNNEHSNEHSENTKRD